MHRLPNAGRSIALFASLLLVVLAGCSLRSTTKVIKSSFLPEMSESVKKEQMSSCLDPNKIKEYLNNDNNDGLAPLKIIASGFDEGVNGQKGNTLIRNIEKILAAERVSCSTNGPQWGFLYEIIKKNHEGLFVFDGKGDDSRDALKSAVGSSARVSVSFSNPASLSMSARSLPAEQEPGNAFSNLTARAQAALIDYAKSFKNTSDKVNPEKAVENLLDQIGQSREPKFTDTRRVELTVSSVLNSATVDDRFDHITAYLSVPALPQTINGKVSLEREFLTRLQAILLARRPEERIRHVDGDIRRALDRMRVRIEIVDPLNTEAATIQLGKITSSAGLNIGPVGEYGTSVASGDTTRTYNITKGVGAGLSASREDTVAKELDRRSYWIDSGRTLFRITQRGMQEASISGSMSSAITVKVPKKSLYVISLENVKKTFPFGLRNIEQPLYASLDALGVVIGTVRVADQPGILFKKEPNGVAYSVAEGPFRLNLWKHDRTLWSLDIRDLLPHFPCTGDNKAALGRFVMYGKQPFVDQEVRFDDHDTFMRFIKLINVDNKYQLVKHSTSRRGAQNKEGKHYYILIGCDGGGKGKNAGLEQNEPDIDTFWFGVDIDGVHIEKGLWDQLPDEIGDCGSKRNESAPPGKKAARG